MQDLGTLGGLESIAGGINNSGYVVGMSDTNMNSATKHAFLFNGNTMIDLGTLDGYSNTYSQAYGINDSGQVVGRNATGDGMTHRAFLYDGDVMLDLCVVTNCMSTGWDFLWSAYDINNNGDIAGYGKTADGQSHAFLAKVVPLPPALWLFGSGLLGLIGMARKKTST
jgi:probable HAF family extracellular repeat protein